MNRTPVRHNVALETKLGLEQTILSGRVLAAIGAVDALVAAHEGSGLGLDGVGEWPQVELVHGTVVEVRRQSSNICVCGGTVLGVDGVTGSFLLVCNEVLCGSLNTSILVASDRLVHGDTSEVWIGGETLPVTASIGRASQGSGDRAESDVCTLGLELLAHGVTTLVEHMLVPRGSSGDTSREDTGVVGETDGQRSILQAKTLETKTGNGNDVTSTRSGLASDHVSLLFESELVDKGSCLCDGILPTTSCIGGDLSYVLLDICCPNLNPEYAYEKGRQPASDQHHPE